MFDLLKVTGILQGSFFSKSHCRVASDCIKHFLAFEVAPITDCHLVFYRLSRMGVGKEVEGMFPSLWDDSHSNPDCSLATVPLRMSIPIHC